MSLRERTRPRLGIIEPCLPSPAKVPPAGPGWLHEIKHDGFRIMARRDGAGVRLFSRNGHDFTLLGRPLILVIVKRYFARGGRELPVVRCGPTMLTRPRGRSFLY
jgi:ATP-dependent DNA ligase